MSDTPRTDAESCWLFEGLSEVVTADFARGLERELAEARRASAEWQQNFETLGRAVVGNTGLSAIGEVRKLKRDAERYRWLRNRHYKGGMLGVWRETKEGVAIVDGWLSGADLDKAIDAAMKEGK